MALNGIDVRCSAIVFRKGGVLLEAMAPGASRRRVDIVFLATGLEPGAAPQAREPGVGHASSPSISSVSWSCDLRSPGTCVACSGKVPVSTPPIWVTCGGPRTAPGAGPRSRSPGSAELLTRDAT